MELRSSIGIFQRAAEAEDNTRPITPPAVFEAAKQVARTKETLVVRNKDGVYVISYSEHGPFNEKVSEEWLPVQIMRLKQWSSGGIKTTEMAKYDEAKQNETSSSSPNP